MHSPDKHTAILLFALPDSVQADRKTVGRSSVAVWRTMRALVRAKTHAAGLPLLESTHLIDHRGSFGEQFSVAVSAVFAQGFERVICVGNDCPDLSITDLRRATSALINGQSPIGADRRGGVYLIGFNRQQFDGNQVTQLPWQTNQLATALRHYFTLQNATSIDLPVHTDVNHRVDGTAVRGSGQVASRLLTTILQMLRLVHPPLVCPIRSGESISPPTRLSGRAPPHFA